MLGLFRKRKKEPPKPIQIPFPEELTEEMREYAKQNVWFNNWIAKYQSGEDYSEMSKEDRNQIYQTIYRIYRELDESEKPKVKFFFTLKQDKAEKLQAYLDENKMTIEEFVLHALEKLDQEQP